jgi:hypothetical protein
MTSNDFSDFVVPEIEQYEGLVDGEYVAQVDHMERVTNDFGTYYAVHWRILRPSEFEGRIHYERFNINHGNDQIRHIAIQNFGKFCVEIGGLAKGDVPSEDNFLFKVANILIRNKAAKDGRTYANVVRRELVDKNLEAVSAPVNKAYDAAASQYATLAMPQTGQASGDPLNDEVPF